MTDEKPEDEIFELEAKIFGASADGTLSAISPDAVKEPEITQDQPKEPDQVDTNKVYPGDVSWLITKNWLF